MDKESSALKLSAGMSLFMALLGLAFAFLTESGAIMLDGLFSLINFLAALLTLRVARLVRQPPDARMHFGYAQYEPFLNTMKSVVILGLAGFAFANAVDALLHEGRNLRPGPALGYAVVAMVGGLVVSGIQRRRARETNSPLLEVEARGWMIDGLLSGVVAVAFLVAIILQGTSRESWIPYLDPGLVVVLVLLVAPVPIRIIRNGLRELLAHAPEPAVQEDVRSRVGRALEGLPVETWHARMHQVGRYFYLMTQVVVKPETTLQRVAELDEVRGRIAGEMEGHHPNLVLDVVFTEDERWVE